jgi:hypothetical protein
MQKKEAVVKKKYELVMKRMERNIKTNIIICMSCTKRRPVPAINNGYKPTCTTQTNKLSTEFLCGTSCFRGHPIISTWGGARNKEL